MRKAMLWIVGLLQLAIGTMMIFGRVRNPEKLGHVSA